MIKKKNISNIDKENWDKYIKDPSDIFDKELIDNKKFSNKFRFKFDLHGYNLEEANKKVNEIINYCSEKLYSEILLVTGKGLHSSTEKDIFISKDLSKLRYSIPDYILSSEELASKIINIKIANKEDGGNGALIIKLKKL